MPTKQDLEKWYSALGILSGFMGVASLVIRMWIMGIDREKEEEKYKPSSAYLPPLSQTLYELS